jgi:hypothetical protein
MVKSAPESIKKNIVDPYFPVCLAYGEVGQGKHIPQSPAGNIPWGLFLRELADSFLCAGSLQTI